MDQARSLGRSLEVRFISVSAYIIKCRYFFGFIARTIDVLRDISFHARFRGKMPMYVRLDTGISEKIIRYLGEVIRQADLRHWFGLYKCLSTPT